MIVSTLNRFSSYITASINSERSVAFLGKSLVGIKSSTIGQSLAAPYKEVVAIKREPIPVATVIRNDN